MDVTPEGGWPEEGNLLHAVEATFLVSPPDFVSRPTATLLWESWKGGFLHGRCGGKSSRPAEFSAGLDNMKLHGGDDCLVSAPKPEQVLAGTRGQAWSRAPSLERGEGTDAAQR